MTKTTTGKRWRWTALAAALVVVPGLAAARGDGNEGGSPAAGISVNGTGTVRARPTVVEITGGISGEAELAADARVKFRDNKKKAITTIENLKMPGLTVESVGSEIVETVDASTRQQMMNGNGGGDSGKTKVRVTDKLRVTLKDADKMDPDKLMETVLKGEEGGAGGGGSESNESVAGVVYSVMSGGLSAKPADDKGNVQGVASGTLADIPVTVKVKVQFDIAK